jgi:hypothetical protein
MEDRNWPIWHLASVAPARTASQEACHMAVKPVPEGYATVTPWIISRDTARLIDYMKEAFSAGEFARLTGADARIEHAEVRMAIPS